MSGDIQVRPARDWAEVRRAAIGAGRAFGHRTPEEPFFFERTVRAPTLPLENTLLVWIGDEIVSQLQLYERQVRLDDARVWIGGLGNVYTLPEHQGEGFGARLLEYTREYLADRGYAFSTLRTGTPGFYRTAGWESVPFDRHRIEDPESIDGGEADDGDADAFEQFESADLDALLALYHASRGSQPGSVHRSRVLWTDWILDPAMEVLSGPDRVQLYRPDGDADRSDHAEGYLVWDDTDDGVACLEIGHAGTDRASFLRACWQFLVERTDGIVEWHPPAPDVFGDATTETRVGDMVQVHSPDEIARSTRSNVETTAELVEYLGGDDFYWSDVDSF